MGGAFRRDTATGGLSQPTGATGCVSAPGIAGCAAGDGVGAGIAVAATADVRHLYTSNGDDAAVAILRVDAATGGIVQTGCVVPRGLGSCAVTSPGFGSDNPSIAVSADGRNVYS